MENGQGVRLSESIENKKQKTLKDLGIEDFKKAFSISFYLEKAKGYSEVFSINNAPYSGLEMDDNGQYLVRPDSTALAIDTNPRSTNYKEYNDFILSNISLATGIVIYYERLLGCQNPERNLNLSSVVLDIAVSRIVLALGANSTEEENLVKRERDIISSYEDRVRACGCRKGKDILAVSPEDNSFTPKGESLVSVPKWRTLNV